MASLYSPLSLTMVVLPLLLYNVAYGQELTLEEDQQLPLTFLVARPPQRRAVQPVVARQMRPPVPLGKGRKELRTDYFNSREYTSRDLPRLIEGFGQQIARDMDKAHAELSQHAETVRALQYRMAQMERTVAGPYARLTILGSLALFPLLAVLLVANCVVLRRIVVYGKARP